MKHPESILQRQCVKWFRLQYPHHLIYANANGGYRSKVEASIMQGEGVTAGIPDLTAVIGSLVVWIEMKTNTGKLSDNQKSIHEKLSTAGHVVHTCKSLDEFIKTIETYTK